LSSAGENKLVSIGISDDCRFLFSRTRIGRFKGNVTASQSGKNVPNPKCSTAIMQPKYTSIFGQMGKALGVNPLFIMNQSLQGRKLMRRSIVLLILVVLCSTTARAIDDPARKITTDQARALVMASLTKEQQRLPKLGAEQYGPPESSSRFMNFTVTWEGTRGGSVVVGVYAVDSYTGDVFSATLGCYEFKNNRLKAMQAQFREILHLSRVEYNRIKTKGPLCEE
jgi:hypothetical protein